MEESELVTAWNAGDRSAGEELLRRHSGCLQRFFSNKVTVSPEDLVQETIVAVIDGHERYEGRSTFRAYLLSIARHRLFEHYRKRKRDLKYVEFDTVTAFDLGPSPSVCAAQENDQRLLLEALRRIPLNYQIVLELCYWEDLSGPEIAEAIGTPLDTAYSRLRKAKTLLKKKLEVLVTSREALETTEARLELWANAVRAQVGSEPSSEDMPDSM